MANVRIKDLTTTAATTASDDFFGVDGATNGTRKLNAYSPTFGGNLTVSGTGTSSVAGSLAVNSASALGGGKISTLVDLTAANGVVIKDSATSYANNDNFLLLLNSSGATAGALTHPAASSLGIWGSDDIRFLLTGSSTEIARFAATTGNLLIGTTTDLSRLTVVKDAAGSDIGAGEGQVMIAGATNTNKRLAIGFNTTSDYGWLQAGIAGTAYKPLVLNNNGGNVLIGTTTDGGQKLQVSGTAAISGGIVGTTTNNSAAAGIVGEIITSTLESGSAVSLTSTVAANVTSISLTAGDWDVTGTVAYSTSGATVTQFLQALNNASASLGPTGSFTKINQSLSSDTDSWFHNAPTYRFSLSATSTVYLIARSYFSAGTVGAYGFLRARRVR